MVAGHHDRIVGEETTVRGKMLGDQPAEGAEADDADGRTGIRNWGGRHDVTSILSEISGFLPAPAADDAAAGMTSTSPL
jgi:hypothetical protein